MLPRFIISCFCVPSPGLCFYVSTQNSEPHLTQDCHLCYTLCDDINLIFLYLVCSVLYCLISGNVIF
jgi:hypothetical protein